MAYDTARKRGLGGSIGRLAFESGELLTVVQVPAQVTVVTGAFAAPPLPGPYGILAGTSPALFAYQSLQVV